MAQGIIFQQFKHENRENGDVLTLATLKLIVVYFGEIQRDYITLPDKQSKEIWKLHNVLGEYRHARLADSEALTQVHGNIYITEQHPQALDERHAKLRRTVHWAKENFERFEPLLTSLPPPAKASGSTSEPLAAKPPPPSSSSSGRINACPIYMGPGHEERQEEGLPTVGKACTSCSHPPDYTQSPYIQEGPHPTQAQTHDQERGLPPYHLTHRHQGHYQCGPCSYPHTTRRMQSSKRSPHHNHGNSESNLA